MRLRRPGGGEGGVNRAPSSRAQRSDPGAASRWPGLFRRKGSSQRRAEESRRGWRRLDLLTNSRADLALGDGEFIVGLQIEPEARAVAEELSQPQGGIYRNPSLAA